MPQPVPAALQRSDLRLTIDYPEDLMVCRRVYAALRASAPHLALADIVSFLDGSPETRRLVEPFVSSSWLYSAPAASQGVR